MIGIKTFLRVDFARVRLDFFGFLESDSGQFAALISVISPTSIQIEMSFAHETVRAQEFRVAPNRFLQEADALKQVALRVGIVGQIVELSCPQIKIVRYRVSRGWFRDPRFLVGRQMSLQLLRDGFGDFALDSEHVSKIASVGLCP